MRQFLVTKLVCAKCASALEVQYEVPRGGSLCVAGEPTGADMVEIKVGVQPCATCLSPLTEMRAAMKTLMKV